MFKCKKTEKQFKGAITFCPYSKGVWVVDHSTLETYSLSDVEVVV